MKPSCEKGRPPDGTEVKRPSPALGPIELNLHLDLRGLPPRAYGERAIEAFKSALVDAGAAGRLETSAVDAIFAALPGLRSA